MRAIDLLQNALGIQREIEPGSFVPPVFLTGCMRSGTTYLAHLLNEHPNLLHLEGELINVWTEIGGVDCKSNRVYADRNQITPQVTANMAAYFERCLLEYTRPKYALWRAINRWKTGSGGVLKSSAQVRLLNKSVHLVNRVDYLLNMFPTAKLIFLIRPIEAQVSSLKLHFIKHEKRGKYFGLPKNDQDSWITSSNAGVKNWNVKNLAKTWINLNYQALKDLERNEAESYMIVDYLNLVNSTAATLNRLYRFLGEQPMESRSADKLAQKKVFNTNTGGNPLDDWKSRLSSKEIVQIEEAKAEQKEKYNYIMSRLA